MSSLIRSEPPYENLSSDSDVVLRARPLALELLVEMPWTDRMSRVPYPVSETLALRREDLGLVAVPDKNLIDQDRLLNEIAVTVLDERLDSIVGRLALDERTAQPEAERAVG